MVLGPAYENFRPGRAGLAGQGAPVPAKLDAEGYVAAETLRPDDGANYSSMAAYASVAAAASASDPAADSRA